MSSPRHLGRRDHRNVGGNRHFPGAGLVAKRAHGLGLGSDEGDAVLNAGIHEIRVFGQQTVTGVDRICAAILWPPG